MEIVFSSIFLARKFDRSTVLVYLRINHICKSWLILLVIIVLEGYLMTSAWNYSTGLNGFLNTYFFSKERRLPWFLYTYPSSTKLNLKKDLNILICFSPLVNHF